MSEELLVRHCAPTLAGLKTGNLINCPVGAGEDIEGEVAALNRKLNPRGVQVRLLARKENGALIYVYRPGRLSRDLAGGAAELLCRKGYPAPDAERCLRCLAGRLGEGGIPPRDRAVPRLPAPGRPRVYRKPGTGEQAGRHLEGVWRRGGRQTDLCAV